MWKCPKCDTMNKGMVCSVCGTPAGRRLTTEAAPGGGEDSPDEVNALHILAWAAAFAHIIFFFLKSMEVTHPDTGREGVAMFMLSRYLSRWREVLVDYSKIALVFNGMSIAFLAIAGVLAVVCVHKITRRDAHGLTPFLILSNFSGLLPSLTFYVVFGTASKMRSLYGQPSFTGLGKIQLACGAVGILAAIAACVIFCRQTADEETDGFDEEEIIIPQPPVREESLPEVSAAINGPAIQQIESRNHTRIYQPVSRAAQPARPGQEKCTRCGRVLRPTSIYCNVCAKPVGNFRAGENQL